MAKAAKMADNRRDWTHRAAAESFKFRTSAAAMEASRCATTSVTMTSPVTQAIFPSPPLAVPHARHHETIQRAGRAVTAATAATRGHVHLQVEVEVPLAPGCRLEFGSHEDGPLGAHLGAAGTVGAALQEEVQAATVPRILDVDETRRTGIGAGPAADTGLHVHFHLPPEPLRGWRGRAQRIREGDPARLQADPGLPQLAPQHLDVLLILVRAAEDVVV